MTDTCNNSAALLLGGTIMAGLVSMAAVLKKTDSSGGDGSTGGSGGKAGVTISIPNTLSSSRAYLLQLCAQYPDRLKLLAGLLSKPMTSTQARIEVLDEFKRFVVFRVFLLDSYHTFTFTNEQAIVGNSFDNSTLVAFIAKCAYELGYKRFI